MGEWLVEWMIEWKCKELCKLCNEVHISKSNCADDVLNITFVHNV